jgi:acyl carrier protein
MKAQFGEGYHMDSIDDSTIESVLIAYIRKECLPQSAPPLKRDQNLFDSGIVDSAGLISFIGFIEREFALSIPDEDLLPSNFASVTAIADYIRSHQQVSNGTYQEVHRLGS